MVFTVARHFTAGAVQVPADPIVPTCVESVFSHSRGEAS